MKTRHLGSHSEAIRWTPRQQRMAAEETEASRNSAPGRKWTVEQRMFFRSWRNLLPSLAYARDDPGTLYVAIDHAARKAAMNQTSFSNRYPLSDEPLYNVKTWWHGRRRRQNCFVLRGALMEVMTRELCQQAMRQYLRRCRPQMADLERELNERHRAETPGYAGCPAGSDNSRSRE